MRLVRLRGAGRRACFPAEDACVVVTSSSSKRCGHASCRLPGLLRLRLRLRALASPWRQRQHGQLKAAQLRVAKEPRSEEGGAVASMARRPAWKCTSGHSKQRTHLLAWCSEALAAVASHSGLDSWACCTGLTCKLRSMPTHRPSAPAAVQPAPKHVAKAPAE